MSNLGLDQCSQSLCCIKGTSPGQISSDVLRLVSLHCGRQSRLTNLLIKVVIVNFKTAIYYSTLDLVRPRIKPALNSNQILQQQDDYNNLQIWWRSRD